MEKFDVNKTYLVDFYTSWCGPCRLLSPHVEKAKQELEGLVEVIKVDCDEESELADKFNIYSVPTLVIIKNQTEVARKEGYQDYQELITWIKNNL